MKIFVTIFDGWKLLTIVTKISILDVSGEASRVIFSSAVLIYNANDPCVQL